jgi:L-ascorbate metabolism protein UlaG (beta-lactamase superfamily)
VSPSDHFDGRRFFNPSGPALQPFTAVPRLLLSRRTAWPAYIEQPLVKPPAAASDVVLTFIGHSTFLLQTPAGNLMTDPVYVDRAGPWGLFGPRRVRRPAVAFDVLPQIDVVLLSHNHYDHCDVRTLRALARRFDPVAIAPLGNARLLRMAGFTRIAELDWWQDTAAASIAVTATPAHHFSARTPFDRNRALWSGFMIAVAGRRIYFAGDTAYAPIFRDIRQRLGAPDVSLIPIGAYEPRWFMRSVHMNPAEAVQAHMELESRESIAMHFGTFQLTTEGIDEPLRALERARRERQIPDASFRALQCGESERWSSALRPPP